MTSRRPWKADDEPELEALYEEENTGKRGIFMRMARRWKQEEERDEEANRALGKVFHRHFSERGAVKLESDGMWIAGEDRHLVSLEPSIHRDTV